MKIIIAGSRNLIVSDIMLNELIIRFCNTQITEVVCCHAYGIDGCGLDYAKKRNIKVANFPANWDKYGKAAGPLRNEEMAKYSDELLLIWDGNSKGSRNMRNNMLKLKKPIYEVIINEINIS